MPDSQWQDQVRRTVPTLQIVIAGLLAGSIAFLVVAVVLARQIDPIVVPGEGVPWMTYFAVVFTAGAALARLIVPSLILSAGRQRIARGAWEPPPAVRQLPGALRSLEEAGDAGKLWAVLCTCTIIAGAILEGTAFLLLVVYMLEQTTLSLIIGIVTIAALATLMPTRSGAIQRIEDQLRLVEQQRQFGR